MRSPNLMDFGPHGQGPQPFAQSPAVWFGLGVSLTVPPEKSKVRRRVLPLRAHESCYLISSPSGTCTATPVSFGACGARTVPVRSRITYHIRKAKDRMASLLVSPFPAGIALLVVVQVCSCCIGWLVGTWPVQSAPLLVRTTPTTASTTTFT